MRSAVVTGDLMRNLRPDTGPATSGRALPAGRRAGYSALATPRWLLRADDSGARDRAGRGQHTVRDAGSREGRRQRERVLPVAGQRRDGGPGARDDDAERARVLRDRE